MITDLLERSVVDSGASVLIDLLDEEIASFERGDSETREAAGKNGAKAADAESAKDQIEQWRKREVDGLSGTPHKPPIWVPRDPVASMLVSEFEDYFAREELTVESTGKGYAKSETALSTVSLSDEARRFLTDTQRRRFWPKFGQRDARFLTWGAAAVVSTWVKGGPVPFPRGKPAVRDMADNARLILVGDWGSGIARAEKVATAMRVKVEESINNKQDCHVIHLGDVYYCGWEREYKKRLLKDGMWPVRGKEMDIVGSWSLNGNHDMYSGGDKYFNYLLAEPRFWRHEGHSYFALQNKHWQVAGLDTAYADADLHGPQTSWLTSLRKGSANRKGLLLTHHQLFSEYEACSTTLKDRLQPLLDEQLITAWIWGHEHRCAAYSPVHGVKYPRVVGHGGVPVYEWAGNPPKGVSWEAPDAFPDALTGWRYARFGFAMLDFRGDGSILAKYINENGESKHSEEFQ